MTVACQELFFKGRQCVVASSASPRCCRAALLPLGCILMLVFNGLAALGVSLDTKGIQLSATPAS